MSAPQPTRPVDPLAVRRAAARFPTGVALVTAPGDLALVIDSFVAVSLEPALVAFSVSRASLTWRRMRTTGRFGISVLGARHAQGIRERARPGADRLAGLDLDVLADGVPVLRDALTVIVCTLAFEHATGDHTLPVGRVDEVRHGRDEPPLVFFGGDFGTIVAQSSDPAPSGVGDIRIP